MLRKFTHSALITSLLLLAAGAATPAPQEAKEKAPKDQAEYELINKAFKEADPAKKLPLLLDWEKKYPESDYKIDRVRLVMGSYQGTNQGAKAVETAKSLLKLVPGDFAANYTITSLTPFLQQTPTPAVLSDGETAAKALVGGAIATQFDKAKKPATVSDAQWNSARAQTEVSAHQTLGWISMQRKDNTGAETEFMRVLKLNPANAQVSYWLGNVVLAQGDPNKNELALFSFARAAAHEGEGALSPAGRKQVDEYLNKVYMKYAGTVDDLPALKATAKNQALPPADLVIKSGAVRTFEKDQKHRAENPNLYKYIDLREALKGADGDATWGKLKGLLTPKMALYVVGSDSARPSVLNLSSEPDGAVEVVLNLENRLRAAPGKGRKVMIDGVATALTKSPFKLTLNDGHTF